jgi:phosphoserine phosphatase
MPTSDPSVLVTVNGPDTPGITAALTSIIADNAVPIVDIEQFVVHGHLTLCMLLGMNAKQARGAPVLKDLLFRAKEMGLALDFQVLSGPGALAPRERNRTRFAVTVIGDGMDAKAIHTLSMVLAEHRANLDRIRRLSAEGLSSIEAVVSLPDEAGAGDKLRHALTAILGEDEDIDVAVQREQLSRRGKRLIVFDMDSTLIQVEVIDELARAHGVADKVAAITERAMAGELDFEESLIERVSLLKGLTVEKVEEVARSLPLTDGAEKLVSVLHRLGMKTAVISGGFTVAADVVKERLSLDYAYANTLVIKDGVLTGEVEPPIVDRARKAALLSAIAEDNGISIEQTIAVGDGANDSEMIERAGLGIAYYAKPTLKEAADTSLSRGGLDRILYLLGLHESDVRELMAGV